MASHDFAWVTDEADCSVVLALLQVAFLGKCDGQGLGLRCWPFSSLPELTVVEVVIICSPPTLTSSARMMSTPADLPFFSDCIAAPHICEGWSGHPLCLSVDSLVLMDLHWPCDCTTQCSILSIGSVSLALFLL